MTKNKRKLIQCPHCGDTWEDKRMNKLLSFKTPEEIFSFYMFLYKNNGGVIKILFNNHVLMRTKTDCWQCGGLYTPILHIIEEDK